jgi:HEPN domain-containing protein
MTNHGSAEHGIRRRAERETSFYGDAESGIPPEELYGSDDAHEALGKARLVLRQCEDLLKGT